jgi:very-short-patch-repair endonuclease
MTWVFNCPPVKGGASRRRAGGWFLGLSAKMRQLRLDCMPDSRRFIPYRRALKPRAQGLRRDPTPAEKKLWYEFLCLQQEKFTRQKPLGPYIADFYCAAARLVIELDGDSHFTSKGQASDQHRAQILATLGMRIIRFTNLEVAENFEAVCEQVSKALRSAP